MTDDRAPEQRDADDQLHAAIDRVVRAYDTMPKSSVITSWLVIGTGLGADGEGDLYQSFTLLPDDGRGMSPEQILGMLRATTLRVERDYLHGDT
jgi:hypothetical protein